MTQKVLAEYLEFPAQPVFAPGRGGIDCRSKGGEGMKGETGRQIRFLFVIAFFSFIFLGSQGAFAGSPSDGSHWRPIKDRGTEEAGRSIIGPDAAIPPCRSKMTGRGRMGSNGRPGYVFRLHCDPAQGPNMLKVSWRGDGNGHAALGKEDNDQAPVASGRWHRKTGKNNLGRHRFKSQRFRLESLDQALCQDDPAIEPFPPAAGFDTHEGRGGGSLNGAPGYTARWLFTDAGEPGKNDFAVLEIRDADGKIVLNAAGHPRKGNHQALGPGLDNDAGTGVTLVAPPGADWVAFQDGPAGAWSRLAPQTPGSLDYAATVKDPAGRYGFAYHESIAGSNQMTVFRFTTAERTVIDLTEPLTGVPTPHTVSGIAVSESPAPGYGVSVHLRDDFLWPAADPPGGNTFPYALKGADGKNDLVAIQYVNSSGQPVADKFFLDYGLDLTGDIGREIDFTSAGIARAGYRLEIVNSDATAEVVRGANLITVNSTRVWVFEKGSDAPLTADETYSLPAAGLASGDLLETYAEVRGSGYYKNIHRLTAADAATDQVFDLDAIPVFSGASVDGETIHGLSYAPGPLSPPLLGYVTLFDQESTVFGGNGNSWFIGMSVGWLNGATAPVPDFNGTPGYDPAWLVSGETVRAEVGAAMLTRLGPGMQAGDIIHDSRADAGTFTAP